MLRALKQVEGLKGPLSAEIWDDGDAGETWACIWVATRHSSRGPSQGGLVRIPPWPRLRVPLGWGDVVWLPTWVWSFGRDGARLHWDCSWCLVLSLPHEVRWQAAAGWRRVAGPSILATIRPLMRGFASMALKARDQGHHTVRSLQLQLAQAARLAGGSERSTCNCVLPQLTSAFRAATPPAPNQSVLGLARTW
jgi:hypothetical protein